MKKLTLFVFVFAAVLYGGTADAATRHNQGRFVCELAKEKKSGDILVQFGTKNIFSDRQPNSLSKNVSIPAGKYEVRLEAFDEYEQRPSAPVSGQTQERYFVKFRSGSTTVATSGKTQDLRDGTVTGYWRDTVNNSLTISQGINNVIAQHVVPYRNSAPNSVNPSCMLLVPIKPPVNGVCNSKYDGKEVASKPGSDRCTTGAASSISGTGTKANPWKWSCAGINGGNTDQCSATQIPKNPAIEIVKRDDADKNDTQEVEQGGTAVFEILVKNIGEVDLKDVKVTDAKEPACNKTLGSLAVGETKKYTCESKNVQENFTNVAVVVGTPVNGTPNVTATDPTEVTVHVPGTPNIYIVKDDSDNHDDKQIVEKGGTATFDITVKNTGDVDLKDVKVTDPQAPACNKDIGDLAVGESKTYECTVKNVTEAFTNIAFVVGTSVDDDKKVDGEDPSKVDVEKEQPVCGNGVWESGEQCDDGNSNNNDSCTNQCTSKEGPKCGNNKVEKGEECDGGKYCSSDCRKEKKKKSCDSSIGNTVWIDQNGNGIQDAGEVGLDNVSVKLIDGNDVERDDTNSRGRYKHDDLCKGTYTVVVDADDIPSGCYQVSDPDGKIDNTTKVRLGTDDKHTKADFGYRCPTAPATGPGATAVILGSLFASALAILYMGFVHPRIARRDFRESIIR